MLHFEAGEVDEAFEAARCGQEVALPMIIPATPSTAPPNHQGDVVDTAPAMHGILALLENHLTSGSHSCSYISCAFRSTGRFAQMGEPVRLRPLTMKFTQ